MLQTVPAMPEHFFSIPVVAITVMASLASAQETSQQFRRLDRNKNGELTKEEFPGPLFDQIDINKDGIVTAEEDQKFVARNRGGGRVQNQTAKRLVG